MIFILPHGWAISASRRQTPHGVGRAPCVKKAHEAREAPWLEVRAVAAHDEGWENEENDVGLGIMKGIIGWVASGWAQR
jgi:hypothetical protein